MRTLRRHDRDGNDEMQRILSAQAQAAYRRYGYLSGLRVMSETEAAALRGEVETLERDHAGGAGGHDLKQFFRVNGQVVIPLLARIARHPAVLDIVQDLLGGDLLVWSAELFIKEPGDGRIVSWHQDITYWGMGETDEEVTAWIALSPVSERAGCMRFLPGSHRQGVVAHADTFADDNLLSRGQRIEDVDEARAVPAPLRPGEMSLHHGRCFHASGPNQADDRRIGLAIRYVTPAVRQAELPPDYAMLVRGVDAGRRWINIAGARALFADGDLALYNRMLRDQAATLAAGAPEAVALYGGAAMQQEEGTSA